MEKEIWKKVPHTDYQASSKGRIRKITMMTPKITAGGYVTVFHRLKSGYHYPGVHSLVAEAFIGKRPKGKFVNHKDGNKQNNTPENLEWVTRKENAEHAVKMGLYKSGEDHYRSKLCNSNAMELRSMWETGKYTSTYLAKRYGVSRSTAHKIATGKGYK